MKFVVYDRGTMGRVPPPEAKWALVSICEKGEFPEVHTNESLVGRLNQQYHDVDRKDPKDLADRVLFSDAHADELLDFYQHAKDNGCEVVFIHCAAGICRSPATAAALQKIEIGEDHIWFATKRPNMLVYRTILERAANRGLLG
jgi:predicted protein tyrosine phosphatase